MSVTVSRLAICCSMYTWVCLTGPGASAQQVYETQGLRASIGEITKKSIQNISVQMILTNTTKFKKYAIFNRDSAEGSLSNGDILGFIRVTGMPSCSSRTKEDCVRSAPDPEYLEGGGSISVILSYVDQNGKLPQSGKMSFPLKMVIQTEAATDEVLSSGAPKEPGPPSFAVIKFTQIPFQ